MSYNTVPEADEYVSGHFMSTDTRRTDWEALDESDKQVLLNQSHDIIDSLPLTRVKYDCEQPDAFPRCPDKEVPQAVKYAEVELAVAYADKGSVEDAQHYSRMVQYGITSYSVGNFSESIVDYAKNSPAVKYGLISQKAERLLTPWLSGGYRVE